LQATINQFYTKFYIKTSFRIIFASFLKWVCIIFEMDFCVKKMTVLFEQG